jgi:pyruvate,water dikinase
VVETRVRRFSSPFEVEPPPGAEGWQRLYPRYYLFREEERDEEDARFWFFDGMHNPEPMYPFDTIMTESWWLFLNTRTTRVWLVPPALGIDQRVLNGYLYVSPISITDTKVIEERVPTFRERAGYYFEHWEELDKRWYGKAEDCIRRLREIEIRDLPEVEDESIVKQGEAVTSGWKLLRAYSELLENMHEAACLHFELLGLGYGAYMTFRDFCQRAFPGILDQTIAKMVVGIEILYFRPDDELRKLAQLALELGLVDVIKRDVPRDQTLEEIRRAPNGERWLAALEEAKEPWFWFSTGPGYSHHHRAWIDDLSVPFHAMVGYIEKLERGESIERPLKEITETRERVTAEYRELLPTEEDKAAFDEIVGLARRVYPHVEDHNFYIEHWHHSIFWNRVREFGRILRNHAVLEDAEDIFFLHRYELYSALFDVLAAWATGATPRGPAYWPQEVAERKRIFEALREWSPPPALGTAPEVQNEPISIMLWGLTTERIEEWLRAQDGGAAGNELRGVAASGGVAEGPARVIRSIEELTEVETGEILVCPIVAPSWAPVFARIRAAVSDVGGIMAHAAIVAREYGLPAVVGTGFATQTIRTGQLIRVDGDKGVVTILE